MGEAIEDDPDFDSSHDCDLGEDDFDDDGHRIVNEVRRILQEQIKLRERISWICHSYSEHEELSKAYLVVSIKFPWSVWDTY